MNTKSYYSIRHFVALVFFLILMCYAQIVDFTNYTHDTIDYWTTGDYIVTQEGIDIRLFPDTFRGYFIYVLVLIFKTGGGLIGNSFLGWRFLASALTTIVLVYCFPFLFGDDSFFQGGRINLFIRYCVLSFVLCFFWGNFIQRPNSDIIASYFLVISVSILKSMINARTIIRKMGLGILAGSMAYATYNIRVAYLTPLLIFICLYIIAECKRKCKSCIVIFSLLIGGLIMALPQMMINSQYIEKWTPVVNTEQLYGEDNDLESVQLFWGLCTPRYETYDGDLNIYEENGVPFRDPVGQEIIRREGLEDKLTPSELFRLLLKYPGDIIGVYVRHFANIMVPLWRENCITDLYINKMLNIILSIGIWLLLAVYIMDIIANRKLSRDVYVNCIVVVLLVLPAIFQAVGGVEIRFFYICYILAYYFVCCKIKYKELWNALKGKRCAVIITCVIIGALWITILGDTLTRNPHRIMLIGDYYYE